MMWNLDRALELVRKLEPELAKAGFHAALGGSVLMRGESRHDLDLLVYPHTITVGDRIGMTWEYVQYTARVGEVLRDCGLVRYRTWEQMHEGWSAKGSPDTKFVEVWMLGDRRVDVIYLA